MYQNGTDITCEGISFKGVISLGDRRWIAFITGDPGMVLRIVREDVSE